MAKPKAVCQKCGSQTMTSKMADFPLKIGERTIVVNRVAAKCCSDCGSLFPTKAGREKINRMMNTMACLRFF